MKTYTRLILIAIIMGQFFTPSAHGAWTVDMFNATHDVQTDMAAIETNINHLKNNFSSATEPANLVAGQWWADTTTGILKFRNAANTGWQYVWDMTNNLPMGSVVTVGTVSYAGTQLLSPVTMSRGTTVTQIATTEFDFNITSGAPVNKAAVPAGTAWSTSYTIQQNTWGIYVVAIDGAGVISFTPGAGNYTSTYTTESLAIAAMPASPAGTCRLGYVTIQAAVTAGWTEGTNALYGGGGTAPAQATNYYVDSPTNTYTGTVTPTPSAYTGIYYVKATYKNYISTPTINLNSLGAKTIKGPDSETLGDAGGTIIDGHRMILYYDGTDFILLNPIMPIHGMQVFTASGTWIRTKGVNRVFVKVYGGGGNSGANAAHNGEHSLAGQIEGTYPSIVYPPFTAFGGAGGHGGYAEGWIDVSADVVVTVGGVGGTSSFVGDTTISATGGTNGTAASVRQVTNDEVVYFTYSNGADGTYGTGTGGSLNYPLHQGVIYGQGGRWGKAESGGPGIVLIYW